MFDIALKAIKGDHLAKPNYQFEKRQRDLAKKRKQEEKQRQKLANKAAADGSGTDVTENATANTPAGDGSAGAAPPDSRAKPEE
ncbi:MAG TPA: hypothetical protein VEP67_10340 [Thiobacillaceae bacterium]|nr:hypothetical protein [Thiobacillaceae bacterium]